MKLYATVSSERATKGQGGNKYITIELSHGTKTSSQSAGRIELSATSGVSGEETLIQFMDENGILVFQRNLSKSKKQTGETCEHLQRIRTTEKNGTWGYKCSKCHKYQ